MIVESSCTELIMLHFTVMSFINYCMMVLKLIFCFYLQLDLRNKPALEELFSVTKYVSAPMICFMFQNMLIETYRSKAAL